MFRIYIFILIPLVSSTGSFYGDHRENKMQDYEPMLGMISADYDNSDTDDMQDFMPILRTTNTDKIDYDEDDIQNKKTTLPSANTANVDTSTSTQKPNEGLDSLNDVFRSLMSMFTNEEMKKPIIPKILELITNKTQYMIAKAKEKTKESAQHANAQQHTAPTVTETPQWNIGDAIYKFLFGNEAPKISRTDVWSTSQNHNVFGNKTHYKIGRVIEKSTQTTQHAKTQQFIAPSVTQKPWSLGDLIYKFLFGKNTPRILFRTDNGTKGSTSRTYNDPDSREQNFNQQIRSSESFER